MWNASESTVKQAIEWHPVNWITDPDNQWKKTKEALSLSRTLIELSTDEKAREKVLSAIQESIGTWVDDFTYENGVDVAGYTHGKLVFEIVAAFVGIEELQLASKTGKFSNEVKDRIKSQSRNIIQRLKPCGCFTAGTLIYVENGLKKIEEIEVGDKVWAFDEKTGKLVLKEVIDTFSKEFTQIFKIYTDNEEIEATHEHPFFIGGKWLKVDELNVGDYLTLYDGSTEKINKIDIVEGNFKVYNFTVDELHNYYITEKKFLVHNGINCSVTIGKRVHEAIGSVKDGFKKAADFFGFKGKNKGKFVSAMESNDAEALKELGLEVNTSSEGKIKNVIQENKRFRNFAEKKQEGNVSANLELKTDNIEWKDVDKNRDTYDVRDNYGNTGLDLPTK